MITENMGSTGSQPLVIRVRGEPVMRQNRARKRAGLPAVFTGYRYLAALDDGTEQVIRRLTKRRYTWAHQWPIKIYPRKRTLAPNFMLTDADFRGGGVMRFW